MRRIFQIGMILVGLTGLGSLSTFARASSRTQSVYGSVFRFNTLDIWACDDAKRDARQRAYCSSDEQLREGSYSPSTCFCNSSGPVYAFPGQRGDWNCNVTFSYECVKPDPIVSPPARTPIYPVVPTPGPIYPICPEPPPPGNNVCERLGGCPDARGTRFEAIEQIFKSGAAVTAIPNGTIYIGECYARRAPKEADHAALLSAEGRLDFMQSDPFEPLPAPGVLPTWSGAQRQQLVQRLQKRFHPDEKTAPFVAGGTLAFREFGEFEHRLRQAADGSWVLESHLLLDLAHPETDLSYNYCLFSARLL